MEQRPIDLRGFRLANNITQGELADYLGVTRGFISSIENGRANLPDKKLEYLYTMSKKEKSWDIDRLMPDSTRLRELAGSLLERELHKRNNPKREEYTAVFPNDYLGISQETYDRIIKGKSSLTPTVIQQLIKKIPDLNAEWLMTGEGDVFLNEIPSSTNNDEIRQELQEIRKEIATLNKMTAMLYRILLDRSPS